MFRPLRFQQRLLVLVASLLLFAQVMGLHRHMHADAAVHGVQSELHFGDAGLHDEDAAHAHRVDDATDAHHEHHSGSEIEISALGDALAKLSLSLLPLGLLMMAVFLLVLPASAGQLPMRHAAPVLPRHPFSLQPPANGPPRLLTPAV